MDDPLRYEFSITKMYLIVVRQFILYYELVNEARYQLISHLISTLKKKQSRTLIFECYSRVRLSVQQIIFFANLFPVLSTPETDHFNVISNPK